jgi:DNA-binding transcriptional MerR regulator
VGGTDVSDAIRHDLVDETDQEIPEEPGYRAPQVCNLVGISYRQLDYWARTSLITPSVQRAHGSGSQRLYSFSDIVQLKVVKRLLDAGMSLKKIRQAMDILRAELESDNPLRDVTLLSDGATIYAAHSADELVDVFQRGQGVFGIAVGPVQDELVGEIHRLFPDHDLERIAAREASAT